MSKRDSFADTFATLRRVLESNAKGLVVHVDRPGDYQVCASDMTDRAGNPLFVAAVQIKKNYVSFHLIPVYTCPGLVKDLSPRLRQRMQGKSCFNFTTIDETLLAELEDLTAKGIPGFRAVAEAAAATRR